MSANVRQRHVPLRSCVVCGSKTEKTDLARIVATPDGAVKVDVTGKLPGRGAYVCRGGHPTPSSLKKGRLDFALRRSLSDEEWAGVSSWIEQTAV